MRKSRIYLSPLLLMLAFFLITGKPASAQYAFGVKGGVNFSNYGGRYISGNYKQKINAAFGLNAHFQTNRWFSVQAELNYDPKGANYSTIKTSQSFYTEEYKDFEEDLNYLTLPVMAKFDIGEKKRIYGYTGLYLSYLISANIKGTYILTNDFDPTDQTITPVDRDYKSDIDNFDVGAVFGLGTDFAISDVLVLFLDGRFNWGWANVAQQGKGNITNNVWSVNLGCFYRLDHSGTANY